MNPIPDLHDIALRLSWALLLGCAIGFERQWHQKMAGLKTNALVALGAAGFVVFAMFGGGTNPAPISGNIVTGIGFLGAGVIMREGISVHGLNTAATLWCSAMVGSLAGQGMMQAAGLAGALVVGANLALRPVANWLNTRAQAGSEVESHYTISLTCAAAEAARLRAALLAHLARHRLPALQLDITARPSEERAEISVHTMSLQAQDRTIEELIGALEKDPSVVSVSSQVARANPEA